MTVISNIRLKIYGNILLIILITPFFFCSRLIRLNIVPVETNFIKDNNLVVINFDKVRMKLLAALIANPVEKLKRGRSLGFDIYLKSGNNFKFSVLNSYLLDKLGQRFYPIQSVRHHNDQYEKDKEHEIEITFRSKSYFNLPAKLHLSPLIFINEDDTLRFPIIKVQIIDEK